MVATNLTHFEIALAFRINKDDGRLLDAIGCSNMTHL